MAVLMSAGATAGAILLPAWVTVMTASLTLIDLHRRHEITMLHNLGLTTSRVVLVSALPAIVGEALLVMLVA
jgi:hypothetical protein